MQEESDGKQIREILIKTFAFSSQKPDYRFFVV